MKKYIVFIIINILIYNKTTYCQSLFDSSYYEIDFISNKIEDTKLEKIRNIKTKSFINILKKTLDEEQYKKINKSISEDLINTFIRNIIINDEKIINNKYYSTIKINFDKKKIINFYREKEIPYIEFYPAKFLLIIYEMNDLNNNLFTLNNSFYSFLNKNINDDFIFQIPNLDINDRFILNKENIINKDFNKIQNFSNKYGLNETILVIVRVENNKIFSDLSLFSNKKTLEKKIELNHNQFEKFFKTLEIETLNMWKEINKIQNKSLNKINCKIKYFNLLELKEIKNNLENISIIQSKNIKTLSYRNIEYDIFYYGNSKILANLSNLNNLEITNLDNSCMIKLN